MRKLKKANPFSVILIATSVILFWRGAWGLMDIFIFPNNDVLSYTTSLVVGILILLLTHKLIEDVL